MKPQAVLLCLVTIVLSAWRSEAQVPGFAHVFVIVLENHEAVDIIGNPSAPYLNRLADDYGLAINASGVTHPSLPNYMALTSGDPAFTTDCIGCISPAANIADGIEATGRTWTAYMEDMPTPCLATDSGSYVAKHNPFVHYTDIVSNAARCQAHVVPFSHFSTDLAANTLPNYVWISPNLCNDMHDCSVATGDGWLSTVVPQILQSPAFANSVLFITFDEGTTNVNGGGQIPLFVVSGATPRGFRSALPVNHYNVLRTIEDAWGLAPLGQTAAASALVDFFTPLPTQPTEQVIDAADVQTMAGAWSKVADPSAAGGIKLSTPDRGAPAPGAPLAAPSSYVEASFAAAPATRYRVWLRIHAQADSKWNDSVFVQFSDSVDGRGNAVNRIGTTSGYVVNLWPCADCQAYGWGWQRNAYWLADSGDVWFPAGGTHTIRMQTREDGVEIDQIVISPSTYSSTAPGAGSADTTIVPKPSSPPLPPTPVRSTPFGGVARTIPGLVAASDFDDGGEGVAYHDTTSGNSGGAYRQTDVDLQASSDGGFNVGWLAPAEWLNYSVTVAAAGSYAVTFRVAAPTAGGAYHLESDGIDLTGAIPVPATGDWQTWKSVTRTVSLASGAHVLRLVVDSAASTGVVGNIGAMTFAVASASSPFAGTPVPLPGIIEAENFDNGGEGIGYHDVTAGNSGGAYRTTDVDIETASSGGYDVGWVSAGEWLQYTVNVTSPGPFTMTVRVASSGRGGTFHVEMDGTDISGPLTVPDTGGWQAWQTISRAVSLPAGVHGMRVMMDISGAAAVGNFDSFTFAR